jgi:superfamily I DNA/RNA helicase
MAAISIRGLNDKALERLRDQARREGMSLNTLAARLLESQAGIHVPGRKLKAFDDLDSLAGTWKAADARAFEAAVAPFSEVDETLWK